MSTAVAPAVSSSLDATELRRQRGLAIAAICLIRPDGKDNRYIVPSQAGKGQYLVKIDSKKGSDWQCECQDFETRRLPCKHIFAVQFAIDREKNPDAATIPAKPKTLAGKTALASTTVAPRPTYKQNWPAYNAAQIHEKAKFQALLAELCQGIPEPAGHGKGTKGGRPPVPMADRVFAMALKVYSTQSGRRASTDMRDARDKGHLSHAPHYSKVSRFLEDPAMTPILTSLIAESARPLRSIEQDFAIDSSGFATSRFVRWYDHKYGVVKHQYDWVKVSVCTGRTTNVVTAVEVDERYTADMTRFAPLLNATAKTFTIREVSADAAYLSLDNMELVTQHGGTPYIAFKANSTGGCGGTLARMFHLYNFNRDEYLAHYHKRSNVESTFSMIKAKFGDSLRSKTDAAMVNEALAKVLCHNVCCLIQSAYELGIEATFWGEEEAKPTDTVGDPMPISLIDAFAWM
jgi:transposase